MPPVVKTWITQHTIWQALTGQLPPLNLRPVPIASATLDSRTVGKHDLFIALRGLETDGHEYIRQALDLGAGAVICEERARSSVSGTGATTVDCTAGRWALQASIPEDHRANGPLVYIVDDSVKALQLVGGFQRYHGSRRDLRVIGVTGSVGKTSTKELAASVLSRCYDTLSNQGNLNNEQGLPLTLLGLGLNHERAVLEMGMYALGEIRDLCALARPQVGIITNIGPSHLSRLGSMEKIAQAKAELVQALPPADEGGVAILNWDDERVRSMADLTQARVFKYGLTPTADLWADEIESAGMEGIRFRFHYRRPDAKNTDVLHVRVPMLGRHSVHTALRAAALGLLEGIGWDDIVAGIQDIPGQIRLVMIPGINDSTVIDDTYNASPASTIAALNLLADLEPAGAGRRVAVMGDMLELGHFTDEGHRLVGRRAADVVDLLVTVGDLGKAIGEEALLVGFAADHLHLVSDADTTLTLLESLLQADDLVLIKGSRAIGMESLVNGLTAD